MEAIQLSFDAKKTNGYKILIGCFILFLVLAIGSFFFQESKSMSDKLLTTALYLCIWAALFYTLRVQIKSALYKDIVLTCNEKGIQLNFFYNVFILWEDLENVKTIEMNARSKSLAFSVNNAAAYEAKIKEGILVNTMDKNMKQYLTPLVLPADMFAIAPEILAEILNKNLAAYKAAQAANNANV